jgi:hypothetical protein
MRDCTCNLNKWQTGFSLTHNSLLIQPPTSPQSSSPICVRILGPSGRNYRDCWKGLFCWLSSCHGTSHTRLIVLVHDIFDRGFVHDLVDHYGNHTSETVWVKINFWKLSRREKTCSTLVSAVRWHTVCFKTTKCKGNRIRICHIISNSFSTPSSALTTVFCSNSALLKRQILTNYNCFLCFTMRPTPPNTFCVMTDVTASVFFYYVTCLRTLIIVMQLRRIDRVLSQNVLWRCNWFAWRWPWPTGDYGTTVCR